MLPWVLLVREAPIGGNGVAGLDLLADLSLAGAFLLGVEMFVTFTFFSQLGDNRQRASTILFPPRPIQRWQMGSIFGHMLT